MCHWKSGLPRARATSSASMRLAGARLALDEQRPLQGDGGVDRELQVVVGDVGVGAGKFHETILTRSAESSVQQGVPTQRSNP